MTPRVAASERGRAQTARVKARAGLWDRDTCESEEPERPGKAGHRG